MASSQDSSRARNETPSPLEATARFEFYGTARLRTGCCAWMVQAQTLRQACEMLDQQFPDLKILDMQTGQHNSVYLISLGGREFIQDLQRPLLEGQEFLILSADAGG